MQYGQLWQCSQREPLLQDKASCTHSTADFSALLQPEPDCLVNEMMMKCKKERFIWCGGKVRCGAFCVHAVGTRIVLDLVVPFTGFQPCLLLR